MALVVYSDGLPKMSNHKEGTSLGLTLPRRCIIFTANMSHLHNCNLAKLINDNLMLGIRDESIHTRGVNISISNSRHSALRGRNMIFRVLPTRGTNATCQNLLFRLQ